jgi:FixJ family two-component response regulator
VRRSYPDIVRILLTGHANLEAAVRAINEGEIYRFLTKPCNEGDLTLAIEHALQRKEHLGASQQPLVTAEQQSAPLHELEKEYPGITAVQRDASGAIILEDVGVDLETLVRTINGATAKRE